MNAAADRGLEDLGGHADGRIFQSRSPPWQPGSVTWLHQPALPRLRVQHQNGRWAVLHASWMNSHAGRAIAVILEAAAPAEVAPMIMAAYGLTDREKMICGLVCQGLSTRRIAGGCT